jgi:tRNA threonylcarbamoyladenosine biosynthesis protein TsaB
MRLLAIDTSTRLASVAVVDAGRSAERTAPADRSHRSADLLTLIDAACRELAVAPRELDAIAVGAGPGSFTGLRIGLATAKGIAFAANRPLWLVSSLAALVADDPPASGVAIGVLDARRDEVYVGAYRDGVLIEPERAMAPGQLAAWATALDPDVRFAGDALDVYPTLAPLGARWHTTTPQAGAVARLALAGPRVNALIEGTPSYIRASEAELKYPDGVPGALRSR